MDDLMNETAEEFAEIFNRMGWTWKPTGKGRFIPTKEQIKKFIIEQIKVLSDVKRGNGDYRASGRIMVTKRIDREPPESIDKIEYLISIDVKWVSEDDIEGQKL